MIPVYSRNGFHSSLRKGGSITTLRSFLRDSKYRRTPVIKTWIS
jgi:hypothetical protein